MSRLVPVATVVRASTAVLALAKTVAGMLSVVRVDEPATDDYLLTLAKFELEERKASSTFADCRAAADTVKMRVLAAIHPKVSKVTIEKKQDVVDSETGIRLTESEGSTLLKKPGLDTLKGIRDTAIISVMLCTGIRASELCNLELDDLRQTLNGELVLHVRKGKGSKTRAVYWGAGAWALEYVDLWIKAAGITEGYVFRGFYQGSKTPRPTKISRWAVIRLLELYPVTLESGEKVTLAPHSLRRTYARRCYDAGMDIIGIQQNLGHSDHKQVEMCAGAMSFTVVISCAARNVPNCVRSRP